MKSLITILVLLMAATGAYAAIELELTAVSRYIWRGFDVNPDNEPVVQPSITAGLGESGLSISLWSSFSFQDSSYHEIDLTVGYERMVSERFGLGAGAIHYGWYWTEGFDVGDHTTWEAYLSVFSDGIPGTPAVNVYHDFNLGDGWYAEFALSHAFTLSDSTTVETAGSLGYNSNQWIDDAGLSDLNLRIGIPVQTGKVTITPFLATTFVLLDAVNPGVDNESLLGITIVW